MEANGGDAEIRPGVDEGTLKNQDLSFLQAVVAAILSQYGWFLLVMCVIVYLLIQYLSKRTHPYQSADSAVSRDPSSVAKRQEALEASRRKMQEELDAKAAEFKEKQQRLEEEKRRQKIEQWESMKEGKSYKGNNRFNQNTNEASNSTAVPKPKADKKPLRSSGYSPLTGDGGGTCSWRPGRRGPSSGG